MMKRRISYWTVTVLLGAFMLLGAIPDLLKMPDAVAFLAHLGYPAYLVPFLGVAKVLGVLTLMVRGFPSLTEWAYAGLTFDLTGALYSHLSVGDPASVWTFPLVGLLLVTASYALYRSVRPGRLDESPVASAISRDRTGEAARRAASA